MFSVERLVPYAKLHQTKDIALKHLNEAPTFISETFQTFKPFSCFKRQKLSINKHERPPGGLACLPCGTI